MLLVVLNLDVEQMAGVACGCIGLGGIDIISEDCTGIEDIADDELTIIAVEGGIIVKGARNMPVEVYDVMGRKVAAGSSVATIIPIDRTGVYMVRVGEYPARKVVVIK